MSDDFTTAAWQQRGQGPAHVVVDNQATSTGGGGGGVITGTVAVSNFPTTQPVSATSLPLPAGAAQDGTDISSPTAMPAGGAGIRGWLSAIWTKLNGTLAVTGTFWQATQPVTVGNFPASQVVSGTVTANTGFLPTLTRGTQGVSGFSVQDLKDAGRTPVILSAMAVVSGTTEAMFTLNKWVGGTVTSGTTYTVTTGKTLRVQTIQYGCRFATNSTTVTFANTKINFRSGNAINSPLIYGDSKMAASNMPTPNSDLTIPDGLEFSAGTVLGFSHLDSAATLLLDVVLVGYEY
jgi:hypothetical protein